MLRYSRKVRKRIKRIKNIIAIMLHLSENIRLIRLLSDKTQTNFGKKFKATKAMIISYEKGKANPDELFITRLAKYAGVTEKVLMEKKLSEEDIKLEKEENASDTLSQDHQQSNSITLHQTENTGPAPKPPLEQSLQALIKMNEENTAIINKMTDERKRDGERIDRLIDQRDKDRAIIERMIERLLKNDEKRLELPPVQKEKKSK